VAVWASPGRNEGTQATSPLHPAGATHQVQPRGGDVPARRPRRASPNGSPDATQLIKIGAPIAWPDMRLAHPNGRHRGGLGVPGRSVRVVLAGDAPPASVAARRFRTERGRRASAGWKPNCSTNCSMNCATNCSTNWATLLGCGRGELPGDRVSSRGGNRRGGFRGVAAVECGGTAAPGGLGHPVGGEPPVEFQHDHAVDVRPRGAGPPRG